jgi:hypothetical protein
MRAIAICGSPRQGGNTETLLRRCLAGLRQREVVKDEEALATIDRFAENLSWLLRSIQSGS